MGQVIYPGICLLGFLLLNPLVEGCKNDTVEARARCPHGAFFHRQFCYQYFDKPVTWYDAEIECQALKTGPEVHLVSILSSAEGRIILLYLKSKRASNVWFGLQCVYSNGHNDCDWSDGSFFSQPLWEGTYPASSSNECFFMTNIQNPNTQKAKQRSCFDTLPYLCKFKADY